MSKRARITDIIAIAARLTKISAADITGRSRMRRIVHVRQAIIAVARMQRPQHTYPEIARRLNRDHSSLVHAFEQVLFVRDDERDMLIGRLLQEADELEVFAPSREMARNLAQRERARKQKAKRPPPMTKADYDELNGIALLNNIERGSDELLAALRAAA
jgi:hypothetical protein